MVHSFDQIFLWIFNADPFCMFPLSCYIYLDNYKDNCDNSPEALKDIDSIVMTTDPFVDILEIHKLNEDQFVLSLTANGLTYCQQLCKTQCAYEDVAEYNINTTEFI